MSVYENGFIVKTTEPDAAGLQEQFGVSCFAGFYSHRACYFEKDTKKKKRCGQGSIFINYIVDFSSQK